MLSDFWITPFVMINSRLLTTLTRQCVPIKFVSDDDFFRLFVKIANACAQQYPCLCTMSWKPFNGNHCSPQLRWTSGTYTDHLLHKLLASFYSYFVQTSRLVCVCVCVRVFFFLLSWAQFLKKIIFSWVTIDHVPNKLADHLRHSRTHQQCRLISWWIRSFVIGRLCAIQFIKWILFLMFTRHERKTFNQNSRLTETFGNGPWFHFLPCLRHPPNCL